MAKTCQVEGCHKPSTAMGMCTMHYKRMRKHGDPTHITVKTPPSQKTHGASFVNGKATAEYNAWSSMRKRCMNPSAKNYPRYGGRGITICERWATDFAAFLEDMGPRPSADHSLDRIDNDGPYSPENRRWADRYEQARNRGNNRRVTFRGREMTVIEAAELSGTSINLVRSRIKRGWSIERACHG